MAAIETYLAQMQMADRMDALEVEQKRLQEEQEQEMDQMATHEGKGLKKRKSAVASQGKQQHLVAAAAAPVDPVVPVRLPMRRPRAPEPVPPPSRAASRVNAWLSDKEFVSQFPPPSQCAKRQGYVRHNTLRLTKGSWWDLWMGRLARFNHALPIFFPHSRGRQSWEIFIMVLVLYNAVSVPLDLSFGMPEQGHIVDYVEYGTDVIFVMDIASNFRTAFVNDQGHLVRDTDAIAYKYLRTWFAVDLLATIPYDLFMSLLLGGSMSSAQLLVLKILRAPRLLRLGRIIRMADRLKSANMVRVVVVVGVMLLISHWLACIWYMLFLYTHFADYLEWGIFVDGAITPDETLSSYLSAFYQSFLMMVGNNQPSHNNLERVFMILVLIMGACFYSAMVGQMAVLVANMNTVALRHRTKQDTTMDVLRYMGLPDKQMARVQAYFNYITQFSHPAAEGLSFLTDLPKALFEELTGYLYRSHLARVPLFSGVEPAFLTSLAGRMRIVMFTPSETIFRAGDLGLEMYIIRKGFVAVTGKQEQMMGLLSPGDYFGEIAMFTMAKRTARCVALTSCDLIVLNTYDLKMVMKDFPTSSQTLYDKAEEKLRQLQVAGRAGFADEADMEYEEEDENEEGEEEYEYGYEEQPQGEPQEQAQQEVKGEVHDERTSPGPTASNVLVLGMTGTPPGGLPVASGRTVRRSDAGTQPADLVMRVTRTPPRGDQQAVGEAKEETFLSSCTVRKAPPQLSVVQQVEITHVHTSTDDSPTVSGQNFTPATQIRSSWSSQLQCHSYRRGLQGTAIAEGNEEGEHPELLPLPSIRRTLNYQTSTAASAARPTAARTSMLADRAGMAPLPLLPANLGNATHRNRSDWAAGTSSAAEGNVSAEGPSCTWVRNRMSIKGSHMLLAAGFDLLGDRPSPHQVISRQGSTEFSGYNSTPPHHTPTFSPQHQASVKHSRNSAEGGSVLIGSDGPVPPLMGVNFAQTLGRRSMHRLVSIGGTDERSASKGHKTSTNGVDARVSRVGSRASRQGSALGLPGLADQTDMHASTALELTLSKMLAAAQHQVATLQSEMEERERAWELEAGGRAKLYRQIASLLQLLKRLSDKVESADVSVEGMNTQLQRIERGAAGTILQEFGNSVVPKELFSGQFFRRESGKFLETPDKRLAHHTSYDAQNSGTKRAVPRRESSRLIGRVKSDT